jgi:hypothetical protein
MSSQPQPALAQALRISGALAVMLTSVESRTTLWSTSAGNGRDDTGVAVLGAAMAEAAAEMLRLGSGGGASDLDDLLVTGPTSFHVLRLVDGQVAHLVLDRRAANLAMARREFRHLVAATAVAAGPPPGGTEVTRVEPAAGDPATDKPRAKGGGHTASSVDMTVPTTEAALAALPQRRASAPKRDETTYESHEPSVPSWFLTVAKGPFVSDAQTLARVVGGLRRLL